MIPVGNSTSSSRSTRKTGAAGISTCDQRSWLPRFHRAGPSTSLDEFPIRQSLSHSKVKVNLRESIEGIDLRELMQPTPLQFENLFASLAMTNHSMRYRFYPKGHFTILRKQPSGVRTSAHTPNLPYIFTCSKTCLLPHPKLYCFYKRP